MLEQDGIKAALEMSDVKQVSKEAHQLAYQHEQEDTYPRLMCKGLIYPAAALTPSCLLSKAEDETGHREELSIPSLERSDFMCMLKHAGERN